MENLGIGDLLNGICCEIFCRYFEYLQVSTVGLQLYKLFTEKLLKYHLSGLNFHEGILACD